MQEIPVLSAPDEELVAISKKGQLSLNLEEMKKIQAHYKILDRNPTDVELETFAQTWSEHCVHKTFSGFIHTEKGEIDNLLKSTVAKVTKELDPPWCFSVFEDNAGIVDFEGDNAVAFKVETHNHPSAIEPFGGAATGIGGVIRDILGVWGEPIANTNVLCFGPLDMPYKDVPQGTKHPMFIYNYVVKGIGTYGNNMGIPTVNGGIYFDGSYTTNPLVYAGTVGLLKKSKYKREAKAGDILLLVGGRTGRDGIHGVTFASAELEEEAEETFGTAVQIGDPIEEEKIKRGILQVREEELGTAITDLGGGGLSSAIGEMASTFKCGAEVDLEKIPLKYPKMTPWEIWISESQERMLLILSEKNIERAIEIFSDEDVLATPVGMLTETGKLVLKHSGNVVGEIEIDFLFNGVPKVTRKASWKAKSIPDPDFETGNLKEDLLKILASPNVASKESVIRTYDHEVKSITITKPLQGIANDGPGDSSVLKPLAESYQGVVISCGMNPEYGKIDPYWMAASAIDEAIRNNVASGGRRIALLDNFCWGNPEKADNLAGLVRASQACYDMGIVFGTPFISGKDSLYNESAEGPVTPTLLISALGIMPDVRKAVTMDLKKVDNLIYIIGVTRKEMGGSHYFKIKGLESSSVPRVEPEKARAIYDTVVKAMDKGLIASCHDLSEGGLGVAASEMAFSGGLGMFIDLNEVPKDGELREDMALFSESNSRFLVEVSPRKGKEFESTMKGITFALIGKVTEEKELVVASQEMLVLSGNIDVLKESWKGGLR